jgi:pyrimidine-nucleoside phosphorylase
LTAYDLILKKRNGLSLDRNEIDFLLSRYLSGEITDYQMSAFLMAVYFKKMSGRERLAFTESMISHGRVLDLSGITGFKVDKHSTGGVGDGVSLSLAPLAASCGVIVPMMSGRGLGHTGGTLDKLESIPGFRTSLSVSEIRRCLAKTGVAMFGQTGDIAPVDRKLYALRDVTGTVDCLDLIAASIMSKKLAEGADGLVLDVKAGRGAFMTTVDKAARLARVMCDIGRRAGKKVRAFVTDMSQPLGFAVGNSLEVVEHIELLKNKGSPDMVQLVTVLCGEMLAMAGIAKDSFDGRRRAMENIRNGKGLEVMRKMIGIQKGDPRVIDDYDRLPRSKFTEEIKAPASGFILSLDPLILGKAAVRLGAGRAMMTDRIDPGAGFILLKKRGVKVTAGEPCAVAYASDKKRLREGCRLYLQALKISAVNFGSRSRLVHLKI